MREGAGRFVREVVAVDVEDKATPLTRACCRLQLQAFWPAAVLVALRVLLKRLRALIVVLGRQQRSPPPCCATSSVANTRAISSTVRRPRANFMPSAASTSTCAPVAQYRLLVTTGLRRWRARRAHAQPLAKLDATPRREERG